MVIDQAFADFAAYDAFAEAWLRACRRALKQTGTIWSLAPIPTSSGVRLATERIGAVQPLLFDRDVFAFWYYQDAHTGQRRPIDELRQALRWA